MEATFPLEPFYFVRHGETNWNKEARIMGQKDIPLNEKGMEQAKNAAKLLKMVNFTLILSSPLIRAYKTAEIIADQTHKPIVVIEELKEVSLGIREGDIKGEWLEEWKRGAKIKGAESYTEFTARAQRAFKEALLHPTPVLIVAHNAVYGGIQEALKVQKRDIENGIPLYHFPPVPSAHSWFVWRV
ncbi:MAG: histidine phosphatase family protein [Alphaproteobacteria bacterium]|nr:histidine phosphatase family protein [Alphaproteobacteria bacterium]